MSNIDTEKILYGTDQKVFNAKFEELKKDFSQDKASEFFETYKGKSLSFILKNASTIIKEPYYGTSFFLSLITDLFIPFHRVTEMKEIANTIYEESTRNDVSFQQRNSYELILNHLRQMESEYKNTIDLFKIACEKNATEYIETMYDYVFEISNNGSMDELYELVVNFDQTCENAYVRIALIVFLMTKYSWDGTLYDLLKRTVSEPFGFGNPEEFDYKKFVLDGKIALCLASKDEAVLKAVDNQSSNFKYFWLGVAKEGVTKPVFTQESTIEKIDIFSSYDLMERMATESVEDNRCQKYDFYQELKTYYECMYEYADSCQTLQLPYEGEPIEVCESYINQIDANLSMLEWTDDGEPDPTLKTHIMTRKAIEKEKESENQKKDQAKKDAIKKTMKEEELEDMDEEDETEDKTKKVTSSNISERKKALDLAFKAIRTINGAREHVVKAEKEKFEEGKKNNLCLGSFKKEDWENVLSAIQDGIKPVSDNFFATKDNYFTIYLNVKPASDFFIESSDEEVNGESDDEDAPLNKKPVKPKEDLATRIQNKAIDHEAKRQEKKALSDEKKTKLKNAGKALSAQPKEWEKSSKNLADKIGKWDIKRRKEFFLKPGFRHKIFRNMKLALMYGGAAKFKPASIPFFMLMRHFSKEKDRRIRNELTRELSTEIKICEEKINDANSNGDQQEKYKLMRLKEKLLAEKHRVQLNSKYI